MLNSSGVVIASLVRKTKQDRNLSRLLVASLRKAKEIAQKNLDPSLFKALQWPTDLVEYEQYLLELSRWTPEQSDADIWKNLYTRGHQELDDRLNQFYWLIDQNVGPNNTKILENMAWFGNWVAEYAKAFGDFLNTTESFNTQKLESFIKHSPKYRIEDSMILGKPNNPSGWLTFNQFFARSLNPGLRPIANPYDNSVVVSPADCIFQSQYKIDSRSKIPEVTIKRTHRFASIEKLLEGSKYKKAFANGTFVHYFLDTYSYHRFHAPVAGLVQECFPIVGLAYLNVNIKNGQFDSPDNSEGAYEFSQARGVLIIDTTNSSYANVGIVAVVPVGMCQVSSVNMTASIGCNLLKGDEFGYFLFGGSDIIVLFQKNVNPQIDTGSHYRLYGTGIASLKTL